MDERERAIRAVAEELHLREQYGSRPDPEVLVRCVLGAGAHPRSLPEDVEAVRRRLLEDPELQPASDERRGRAFLEHLRERRFGDDWDLAYLALDDVIRLMCDPKGITEAAAAALGPVLRVPESAMPRRGDDEPREKDVSDETPQVMEVANPAERAAAGVDESLARWRGHSDEELKKLMFGLIEAESEDPRPGSDTLRAELTQEIAIVLKRREAERPSYRGPGRYRHHGGDVYEVLGKTPEGARSEQVILHRPTDAPGQLLAEMMADFEDTFSGRSRYEYLGPLEG